MIKRYRLRSGAFPDYAGTGSEYFSIRHEPNRHAANRHAARLMPPAVMPRLDLGISWRHFRSRTSSSANPRNYGPATLPEPECGFTPGDAKIKSWHDGGGRDGGVMAA